jgi:homoserine O-succinyltransferase
MALVGDAAVTPGRPLRIGIINIMPRAETYEANLLRPLSRAPSVVAPVWIRLTSHRYGSSDGDHIATRYATFEQAVSAAPLDGLILTGAPVEEMAFEEVHYWTELVDILRYARDKISGTLGLCWGGLALAKQLGLDKQLFRKKLFGVYRSRNLSPERGILADGDDLFWCAHSRHSGIRDQVLEAAAEDGRVTLLAHGPETGYSIFESRDGRYLMHLGHPEYDAGRLVFEWERDRALGRADVEPPRDFDPGSPLTVWRSHCLALFSGWLQALAPSAQRRRGDEAQAPAAPRVEFVP